MASFVTILSLIPFSSKDKVCHSQTIACLISDIPSLAFFSKANIIVSKFYFLPFSPQKPLAVFSSEYMLVCFGVDIEGHGQVIKYLLQLPRSAGEEVREVRLLVTEGSKPPFLGHSSLIQIQSHFFSPSLCFLRLKMKTAVKNKSPWVILSLHMIITVSISLHPVHPSVLSPGSHPPVGRAPPLALAIVLDDLNVHFLILWG